MTRRRAPQMLALSLFAALALACGETRRSIGEECLRDEDCLSGTCSARACVPAAPRVTGATASPPDESPRIPDASSAPVDAGPG